MAGREVAPLEHAVGDQHRCPALAVIGLVAVADGRARFVDAAAVGECHHRARRRRHRAEQGCQQSGLGRVVGLGDP